MSVYSGNVNGILGNINIISANSASRITDDGWGGFYTGNVGYLTDSVRSTGYGINILGRGAISALGNMTAETLNWQGQGKYISANTGQLVQPTTTTYFRGGPVYTFSERVRAVPWMNGYFRQYWKDPTTTTFGANTAIPALTGVMPAKFTDMQGSFLYYVDLQIQRLSGNNSWDNFYFINVLNQLIGYVVTCNTYTSALLTAEATNLKYYGFNSYNEFVTQGWDAYKASLALPRAFRNLGVLVTAIRDGNFGTSNAVAKTMIDYGLGAIGNLSGQLFDAGIIYQQISNPNYTTTINNILSGITDTNDLAVIQTVLKTNVNTSLFTSPLSYTSIEAVSGLTNDSGFTTLKEVGADIYIKAPGNNFALGTEVATLIENIQQQTSSSIEDLKTNDSLLTPDLIAQLRTYLPTGENNAPISLLNVIGTASGYYAENIELVNEGIAELYATDYGPQIINILSEITRYGGGVAVSEAEENAAKLYRPVPPPQTKIDEDGNSIDIPGTGGPNWWRVQQNIKINEYIALLNTIVADPAMASIVNKINTNYDIACGFLHIEHTNYIKANLTVSTFGDNTQIFSFVSSLPELGVDRNNIGTDYFLYQLATPSTSGNIAKTLLNQAKNNDAITNIGGKVTGII